MVATKNRATKKALFLLGFAVLLAGCMPPGPRALWEGKKLLDAGKYPQAVAKLEVATRLLQTNAPAWNYLGLAHHRAGQPTNAVNAYRKALMLNQNLAEARFNLGCLWLEQNRPELAKEQFTTYTLLPLERRQTVEGLLKLGAAQLRTREPAAAADSFQKALRLNAQNPEALNGIGMAHLQRNHPREAAQSFNAALKQQPDYRPALLNSATVSLRYLNDPAGALQKYREYLALQPRAADWATVNAIAQTLEAQLSPAPRPSASVVSTQTVASTNALKSPTARPPATTKSGPPAPVKTPPQPAPVPAAPLPAPKVVTLPPEPVIKTAPDAAPPPLPVEEPTNATPASPVVASAPTPAKRSFLQRLNPFHRGAKTSPKPTPLPANSTEPPSAISTSKPAAAPPASPPPPTSRYSYLNPRPQAAGDHAAAERAFAQGVQFQRANRLNEAAAAFKQAAQLDPAYFEAAYNLGLVTYAQRNYRQSLAAWENALVIRTDSTDARYNFALALKAAGHPRDAANELEKLLATSPKEARAHLVLGNLYAESLADPTNARAHYVKVLELDPRHPQATAIRYWLVANPP